jgi:hypothetical protein
MTPIQNFFFYTGIVSSVLFVGAIGFCYWIYKDEKRAEAQDNMIRQRYLREQD